MDYTLHQLKLFVTVADTGSMTRASELMNISQPGISAQIKKFQDQFDSPLLEVISRQVYFTDFGKEILAICRNILDASFKIEEKAMERKGKVIGTLKIATVSTAKYIAPYLLSDFITQHNAVDLIMDVTNKATVIQNLKDNLLDFALVSTLPSKLDYRKLELMPNRLFLIGNKFIDKNDENREEKLRAATFIFREPGSATRKIMENYMEESQITIRKRIELTSNEAVKQAVIAGLGYSIMPLIGIRNEIQNGDLYIIPTNDLPIITTWHLIWLRNKQFSPVASAFLKHLDDQKETLIRDKFSWYTQYQA
jgi:DNA-binding transcriptional LysR family regulator